MIETSGLCAGYGGEDVLQDVTASFPYGQVTVVLGPNGCGKSTLFKTILGLHKRRRGSITVDGTPSQELTPRQLAKKAAYLAQSRNVPNITVFRMVLHGRFPYLVYPRRYRSEDTNAAWEALRRTGADTLADRQVGELSGGQRQKVYIAMALAQGADTIFMDEPTTFLDVRHQLETMDIIQGLTQEGRAVVLVLHDICMALRVADRVLLMEGGRVCFDGDPEELFESGLLDRVFSVHVRRFASQDGWQYYCLPERS